MHYLLQEKETSGTQFKVYRGCSECYKLCGRHQLHFPLRVMEHTGCDSFESFIDLIMSCSSLLDCVRRFLVVMFTNIH